MVIGLGIDVPRVGDLASIEGGLPLFHIPAVPLTCETLKIILPYALILAAIGLIESLLTLNLVDEMTGERGGAVQGMRGPGRRPTSSPAFFGGMGGCAMIGQIDDQREIGRPHPAVRHRRGAVPAVLHPVVASPLIEQIPLAALVGVMFMVVIGTFAWNSLTILRRVPATDAFVIGLVTIVTVATDLAIAVVVGVIVSALAYAWQNAKRIHAKTYITPEGAKVYQVQGPLFFGSTDGFTELFDPENDPDTVIVDFADSRVADQSALTAIEQMAARYEAAHKQLQLRHLSHDCHRLLSKAGQLIVDSDDDPDYEIAVDYSVRTGILGAGH